MYTLRGQKLYIMQGANPCLHDSPCNTNFIPMIKTEEYNNLINEIQLFIAEKYWELISMKANQFRENQIYLNSSKLEQVLEEILNFNK